MKPDLNNDQFKKDNPFVVPEGYFDQFEQRLMDRLQRKTGPEKQKSGKVYLRPYLTLAASITGIALVTYLVLQSIPGKLMGENEYYDIELLDNTGIIHDESAMAESYENLNEPVYTNWEKDAMNYLATNDVDILLLLE
ncbi:MAG: hypothetical protein K9J30_01860 [Bacteroidales bacterium]|nr:hypothetical protein [Bacteroidales bacterium]